MLNWQSELAAHFEQADIDNLAERIRAVIQPGRHGDWPRWEVALNELPACEQGWLIENGQLQAGGQCADLVALEETLKALIPWRKGPVRLGGVCVETEWRSDWKWSRIAPHIDISGHRVLDIGAGNGYFGFQMLNAGADRIVGCDPSLLFMAQYLCLRHFSGPVRNLLLPLRFEDLSAGADFNTVFSMGVLYHRKDPVEHIGQVFNHLRPGGQFVLETLTIPGDDEAELDPPDRYANMRNVHRLPTVVRLQRWLEQSGFVHCELIDQTITTTQEQRTTPWMPFHSLAQALNSDLSQTTEGHPPPVRTTIKGFRPES